MIRVKHHKIDDDVAAILRNQVACDGSRLVITGERLDPTMYRRVNKTLELLGGKWSRKDRAHLFSEPPQEVIAAALDDGKVLDRKQTYQFFQTPRDLAARMVALADLRPGLKILEPSAGHGAIADVIRQRMPAGCDLSCVELDDANVRVLMGKGYEVSGVDFLRWGILPGSKLEFDRILMNPPFANYQDVHHVRHAFELLKPGGRLVAITGTSAFANSHKVAVEFRSWLSDQMADVERLPGETFKESGTSVPAMLITVRKGAA